MLRATTAPRLARRRLLSRSRRRCDRLRTQPRPDAGALGVTTSEALITSGGPTVSHRSGTLSAAQSSTRQAGASCRAPEVAQHRDQLSVDSRCPLVTATMVLRPSASRPEPPAPRPSPAPARLLRRPVDPQVHDLEVVPTVGPPSLPLGVPFLLQSPNRGRRTTAPRAQKTSQGQVKSPGPGRAGTAAATARSTSFVWRLNNGNTRLSKRPSRRALAAARDDRSMAQRQVARLPVTVAVAKHRVHVPAALDLLRPKAPSLPPREDLEARSGSSGASTPRGHPMSLLTPRRFGVFFSTAVCSFLALEGPGSSPGRLHRLFSISTPYEGTSLRPTGRQRTAAHGRRQRSHMHHGDSIPMDKPRAFRSFPIVSAMAPPRGPRRGASSAGSRATLLNHCGNNLRGRRHVPYAGRSPRQIRQPTRHFSGSFPGLNALLCRSAHRDFCLPSENTRVKLRSLSRSSCRIGDFLDSMPLKRPFRGINAAKTALRKGDAAKRPLSKRHAAKAHFPQPRCRFPAFNVALTSHSARTTPARHSHS